MAASGAPSGGKDLSKWETQYRSVFKHQRYPRQLPARPTSASRKNNPHPVQDFVLKAGHKPTREEEVIEIMRSAVTHSAPVYRGETRNLNAIPVGNLTDLLESGKEVFLNCSQLPQQAPPVIPPPRPPHSATVQNRGQPAEYNLLTDTHVEDHSTTTMMRHGSRDIIMHRGLSPRRAAPPVMPGRSLTHYGSFGNRPDRSYYMDGLDLYSGPYNPSSARQSRPMHRHLRTMPKGEGYLHNHSIYYSTTPNVSGYFIIHPDWVSERLSMRRAQSLLSF